MTKGLNWKEQLHWELYKQYLGAPIVTYTNNMNETQYKFRPINDCFRQSKIATEQFINGLAADAREELEGTGWEEKNFQAMVDSYTDQWNSQRNGDCYSAVERALAGKPLNH
jgi:hypothetical protein